LKVKLAAENNLQKPARPIPPAPCPFFAENPAGNNCRVNFKGKILPAGEWCEQIRDYVNLFL